MTDSGDETAGARARISAPVLITIATAIGGGSGYVLTIFAATRLGAEGYTAFAVFWSSLYLVLAALAGVQQEVVRGARPASTSPTPPTARNFALVASAVVAAVVLGSSPLWAPLVFPGSGWGLVVPLAFGAACYVLTAVTAGVLYGLSLWTLISGMIVVDGILRLLLTGGVLLLSSDPAAAAWAIVAPFFITPVLLWIVARRRLVGKFELDVGARALYANVARTVAGSAAAGVLISGFPVLLGATSPGSDSARLAPLLFAINLARAPLVVVVLSLQSYFVVMMQRGGFALWRLLGAITAGTAVISLLALWLGPAVLLALFGGRLVVAGTVLAAIVASGGLVGLLCVTGALVLSRGRHSLYSAGWIVAAVATVALLLLPLPLEQRAVLALCAPPVVGLVVHGAGLLLARRSPNGSR